MTYKTEAVKDGLDADFYHFGAGQGGSADANVARWKSQFQDAKNVKNETRKKGSREWRLVKIEGTFMKGAPFGPKTPVADQRMLGAIVEDKGGTVFVKLVDDGKKVDAAVEKAFIGLIESGL